MEEFTGVNLVFFLLEDRFLFILRSLIKSLFYLENKRGLGIAKVIFLRGRLKGKVLKYYECNECIVYCY